MNAAAVKAKLRSAATAAAAKLKTELAAKAEFVTAATGAKFKSLKAESATKDKFVVAATGAEFESADGEFESVVGNPGATAAGAQFKGSKSVGADFGCKRDATDEDQASAVVVNLDADQVTAVARAVDEAAAVAAATGAKLKSAKPKGESAAKDTFVAAVTGAKFESAVGDTEATAAGAQFKGVTTAVV